jgi:hypothetical protein
VSELNFHPVASIFPLLDDDSDELRELVDDIKKHGLREPIALFGGMILDGRNRYRACQVAGVEPQFREVPPATVPVEFVLSLNLYRRHLNRDQRKEVVNKLREMGWSVRAIAEKTGTPKSTVARDLESPVPFGTPERVVGRDDKSYPAARPSSPELDLQTQLERQRVAAQQRYGADGGHWTPGFWITADHQPIRLEPVESVPTRSLAELEAVIEKNLPLIEKKVVEPKSSVESKIETKTALLLSSIETVAHYGSRLSTMMPAVVPYIKAARGQKGNRLRERARTAIAGARAALDVLEAGLTTKKE